jgi:hypothetical protein
LTKWAFIFQVFVLVISQSLELATESIFVEGMCLDGTGVALEIVQIPVLLLPNGSGE